MAYLIFAYDRQRKIDLFFEELAVTLFQPSNNFEVIDANAYPKKANEKCTLNQLVAFRLRIMRPGTKLIVKTKNEISSDKHLVSTFSTSYIGYIQGNLDKTTQLHGIRLEEIIIRHEQLKKYVDQQNAALGFFKDLNFSAQEIAEFQSLAENCVRPLHDWIDLHAKSTKDELEALPPFLVRGF